MKKIILLTLLALTVLTSYSQTKKQRKAQQRKANAERIKRLIAQEEEGTIIFNKQNAMGLHLNTDGYGLYFEHGRAKSIRKTNLFSLELGERKSQREQRVSSIVGMYSAANPFIFGKINNFYYAKLGFAQSYLIAGKGNKNGVALTAIYGGGFSAGFLKPYFLKVSPNGSLNDTKDVRYRGEDTIYYTTGASPSGQGGIIGASGFTKGFGYAKFVPGFHAKFALRFDYGRYNEVVSALETGVNAEYYTQEMPIMAIAPSSKFFFNAYVRLLFGRRK